MNLVQAKKIYFCGIGGIGMSALAQLLNKEGKTVFGSDLVSSTIIKNLKKQNIKVTIQQSGSVLAKDTDLLIYSSAVPAHHPERQKAKILGIASLSYFEALGQYSQQFEKVIAISGTHGKSTTTAMIASVLIAAKLDPTVIVGSIMKELKSNARAGQKKYLVVEACEHQEHMLQLHPHMIILTNIEEDHLDYYHNLDHIVMAFQKYINHLPADGILIKNNDDSESRDLGCDCRLVTYGLENTAEYTATEVCTLKKQQHFVSLGSEFILNIPGRFNVANAMACIAACRVLGIKDSVMQITLAKFRGIWRRFEAIGKYRGATVISDYAHHPTAIHSTIRAAREFYPKQRIVLVFQPHQRSRTQKLFDKFVNCFTEADFVIIQEIYDVAGREDQKIRISSQDLVKAIEKKGKYAFYTKTVTQTRHKIDEVLDKNDVLLIMGAGDIYKLGEKLVL